MYWDGIIIGHFSRDIISPWRFVKNSNRMFDYLSDGSSLRVLRKRVLKYYNAPEQSKQGEIK